MCDGTEQNLLNSTCDGIRLQSSKRQAIQQPCRDVAVTCIGMFIYKNTYWVRIPHCVSNGCHAGGPTHVLTTVLLHLSFTQIWRKRQKELNFHKF